MKKIRQIEILNNKRVYVPIFILYVIYHISTLVISPIAWYDEICMASETHSFITYGKILLNASPHFFGEETQVLHYGPIYFLLTGFVTKVFGFGIFQYRIVGMLFSLFVLFVFHKIIKKLTGSDELSMLGVFILMFDKFFITASHNGRMEPVALFFILYSYYFLISNNVKYKNHFLSGLFAVISVLITPRVGFLIIPIVGLYLWMIYEGKQKFIDVIKKGIVWSIPFVLIYSLWVVFFFDSFSVFMEQYTSKSSFVGGSFSLITVLQYPMLIVLILLIVMTVLSEKLSKNYNLFFLLGFVLFYVFVKDYGPYTILVIPLIYLLIINMYNSLGKYNIFFKYAILSLLFLNISFFIFKTSILAFQFKERTVTEINEFIDVNIPEGSTVVGGSRFYYSVIGANSNFLYNDEDFSDAEFERLYRTKDNYDYLIISKDRLKQNPKFLEIYSSKSKLKYIGSYEREVKELPYIGSIHSNYFCDIYKRIKN